METLAQPWAPTTGADTSLFRPREGPRLRLWAPRRARAEVPEAAVYLLEFAGLGQEPSPRRCYPVHSTTETAGERPSLGNYLEQIAGAAWVPGYSVGFIPSHKIQLLEGTLGQGWHIGLEVEANGAGQRVG